MATSSNKLVDKYQYNDSQTKTDGFAQIITAKHIVLRQMFTLKKISISNPKAASKYHGIVNQMNVLKSLGDQPFLFKCHKMLKTSNNLYLVYDFMGKYPTLANLIENHSINGQSKKKIIALHILKCLMQLKKKDIVFLDLNAQIIQVNDKFEIKFLNLENAIFLKKNITSLSFLNLKVSQNLSPQVKDFIETCSVPYQKEIQYDLFKDKLDKADLFSFGKILQKLFSQQFQYVESQTQKNISNSESFQQSIKKIVQRLLSVKSEQRPSYEQIENLLSQNKTSQREIIKSQNPQIKISRLDRGNNTLSVTSPNNEMKKSRSAMKSSRMNALQAAQLLSIPSGEDEFDKKSVRSSGDYTDSTSYGKIRHRKSSFSNQIESQVSIDDAFKGFIMKVLTRRNLCKLLLNISKLIFETTMIDLNQRAMLSFLLLKKAVLLTCSLARFVSTGKGDGQQLVVKESVRRQFAKTNDFFLLSVLVDKQMDNAKTIYQTTVAKFRTEFTDLKTVKEYNFDYECISQNLNQKVLKQLVKKSIIQVLKKLQTPIKQVQPPKKPQRNLLDPTDKSNFLYASIRSSRRKDSDFDETTSVRSARTIRTTAQGNTHCSEITLQSFHSQKILRNISFDKLILLYLMGLILDFESYEKMFSNLIEDSTLRFQDQSLLKQLKKLDPKQLTFKLAKMVK